MMKQSALLVAALAATAFGSNIVSTTEGINNANRETCAGAWTCPPLKRLICASNGRKPRTYFNMCVFKCLGSDTEEFLHDGACKATIKAEQAKCNVYDDKRLECVGADGCAFSVDDSNGNTLGDGFNAGSGGGEAGQTLACWSAGSYNKNDEGSLSDFTKKCKKTAQKDDGTEVCEVVAEQTTPDVKTYSCEKAGCRQDLDEMACVNLGCDFKEFAVCNAIEEADTDECAELEASDCGGNAKCKAAEGTLCVEAEEDDGEGNGEDEEPDESCYGFQPEFDEDGVPASNDEGIILNKEKKTLELWCEEDTDKDEADNSVCKFTAVESEDAVHLGGKCESSNPCVGLDEDKCKEADLCKEEVDDNKLFARCVAAVNKVDIDDGDNGDATPCFAFSSESNCVDGECAWVSADIKECCDEDGNCFQVPDEKNCDVDGGATYTEKKKESCTSKCSAAGANKVGCKDAGGCCFVDGDGENNGACYDLNADGECPVETLEEPDGDGQGVPTGSDIGGGGGGCFASDAIYNKTNCLVLIEEDTSLQACMWIDNPFSECLGPRDRCANLNDKRCDADEKCTLKVTEYGYCSNNNVCIGKNEAECEKLEGCAILFGVCLAESNLGDLEALAANGTCAYDVHRNEPYSGDIPCGARQIFNASLRDDGQTCDRQLDIDGNVRCEWTKPMGTDEDMMCMNTTDSGAEQCATLFRKSDCAKSSEDPAFTNVECAWAAKQYAEDKKFAGAILGGGKVCKDKQYTQEEICERYDNDYACEATSGCAFEKKINLVESAVGRFDKDSENVLDPLSEKLVVEVTSEAFANSFCQNLVKSAEQCEKPKKKDGGGNVCAFVEVETVTCRISDELFSSNTTDFADLPACVGLGKQDCAKLDGCEHTTTTQGRCAAAPNKCTTYDKDACLEDDTCLYHPPGKGVCQETELTEAQAGGNLTEAEQAAQSKCKCLPEDDALHYNKDKCEKAGCAFYTREQASKSGLESNDATGGGDGSDGSDDPDAGDTGNGIEEEEAQDACTERPKTESKKETETDDDEADSAPDFCKCYNEPDSCSDEEAEAAADDEDDVADCTSISAEDACKAKQTRDGSTACDWVVPVQKHTCDGGSSCSEDGNGFLHHPVTGQLNQTECTSREGCEVVAAAEDAGSCSTHNPCAVHNGREGDCAQAKNCAYNGETGNCAITNNDKVEDACEDASCCANFAEEKTDCNKAAYKDGSRACMYLEKSGQDTPTGYCGPSSPDSTCNVTLLSKSWTKGSEKSECNAVDGCSWDEEAEVTGSCEGYNVCIAGTIGSKNEDTCHKILDDAGARLCGWFKGKEGEGNAEEESGDGQGACFALADLGDDVADIDSLTQEEVEDGLAGAGGTGSGLGVTCMVFTDESKCKSQQNDDGSVACMFLEGYCINYDKCRADKAGKNSILCKQAGCSWEADPADFTGRKGKCLQKPDEIDSADDSSYACQAAVEDVRQIGENKVEGTLTAGKVKGKDFKPKPKGPTEGCCVLTEGLNPSKITCVDRHEVFCADRNSELIVRGTLEDEIMYATFKANKECAEVKVCKVVVTTKATTKKPKTQKATPAPPPATVNPSSEKRLFLSFVRGSQNRPVLVFDGQSSYTPGAVLTAAEGLFGLASNTPNSLAASVIAFRDGGVQINLDGIPGQYLPGLDALQASVDAVNQNNPAKLKSVYLKLQDASGGAELAAAQLKLQAVTIYDAEAEGKYVPTAPDTPAPATEAPPPPPRVTVPKKFTEPETTTEAVTTPEPTTEKAVVDTKGGDLTADAIAGATRIEVTQEFQDKLSVGDVLTFNSGTSIQEKVTVTGFGSVLFEPALKFNHGIGSPITAETPGASTVEPTTQKQRFVQAGGLGKVDDSILGENFGEDNVISNTRSGKGGSTEESKKVNPSTVAVVGVLMFLILIAGLLIVWHMKKRMDVVSSDPNYVRGMGQQVYGNPAYAPGPGVSEADEGYLDIQEAARRAQSGGAKPGGKKKGLIRQESLC